MSDTNRIPMHTGVRVKSTPETTEHAGKVGTAISRPADNRVEVEFAEEGGKSTATFHQDELEVLT